MILEISLSYIQFKVTMSERNLGFQIVWIHVRILLIKLTPIIWKSVIEVIVEGEIIFLHPTLIIFWKPNRVGISKKKEKKTRVEFLPATRTGYLKEENGICFFIDTMLNSFKKASLWFWKLEFILGSWSPEWHLYSWKNPIYQLTSS